MSGTGVWVIDDECARLRVARLLKSIDHDLMTAVHLVTEPPRIDPPALLPPTLLPMPTRRLKKRRIRRSKALRTGGK